MIYIGTAGWSIPTGVSANFSETGTHLERFARTLTGAEINSSFYRPHRGTTYARWAASVPETFRFSVKIPKTITHEGRLLDAAATFAAFMDDVEHLGEKLGCLLVQLPPKLAFDSNVVEQFFGDVRERFDGPIACEPRHATWFAPDAIAMLPRFRVARVAADPAIIPDAAIPGASDNPVYLRLHGSPKVYYSSYSDDFIERVASTLRNARRRGADSWCIFDNTASGAAASDALKLQQLLQSPD